MNKLNYNYSGFNFNYYLRDDVDFSVFNEIFKFNEYRISNEKIINAKYPIIDIGAHVGFFSIYAFALNRNVPIYSIEPEKNNLEILLKHKNENNINNIKIINAAISGETRSGELIIENDSINHKVLNLKSSKNKNIKTQNIDIFSLKDFLNNNNIDNVSLIKIDIEGGEYSIFESLEGDTFKKIESFVLEYHLIKDSIHSNKNQYYLEKILRENGFSVQIFPSKFDKDMGFIFALNKRKK